MKCMLWGLFLSAVVLTAAEAAPVSGQGIWETTLQLRDADGVVATTEAWYDTAQLFIGAMNTNAYLGITSWRLPNRVDIDNDGCLNTFAFAGGTDCGYNTVSTDPNASEMSSMFYHSLANLAFFDTTGFSPVPGYGLANSGPFSNLQDAGLYWYGQSLVTDATRAWYMGMPSGGQRARLKNASGITALGPVWAVASGDVFSVVPVPAAA